MSAIRSFLALLSLTLALAMVLALPARAEQTASVLSSGFNEDELVCLALNIYWEAGGEPVIGQEAVAHVTLNRVQDSRFPASICAVVQQGGHVKGCQFSWWCDSRADTPVDRARWQRSMAVARDVLGAASFDPTDGALFFHATHVSPQWGRPKHNLIRIGGHVFFQ